MTCVRILLTTLSVMPLLALTACGSDSDAAAPKNVSGEDRGARRRSTPAS